MKTHIVGAGGAGMSAIARVLLARGEQVSGSDAKDSRRLRAIEREGAIVWVGHDANRMLEQQPDRIVASTAIPQSNVELAGARAAGLQIWSRATQLADLLKGYRVISVAGTHGKTTTTSMATVALQHCAHDPSFIIGSELNESGSNAHQGSSDLFVVEADESDGTFLLLPTEVAIVTNVEPDHLNYWSSFDAIKEAFTDFVCAARVSIVCGDDVGAVEVVRRARARGANVTTYGFGKDNDVVLKDRGNGRLQLAGSGLAEINIQLVVPGQHNMLNAAAALLAATQVGANPAQVAAGLETFTGTHRRFEFHGSANGVRVYDDYAHHPTEIAAVIRAARSVVGNGRILVAFQAHHYYRTAMFTKEFGQALGLADFVVVLEVFAPGETPIPGASGEAMAANVPLASGNVVFEPSWSKVPGVIANAAHPGDLVLTLGAGDIGMMCGEILSLLEAGAR